MRIARENDLLREYRTHLIVDVVTGKLGVRESPAVLLDEFDAPTDATAPIKPENAAERQRVNPLHT